MIEESGFILLAWDARREELVFIASPMDEEEAVQMAKGIGATMYYEISVAERVGRNASGDYRHLFATHPRSITNEREAKKAFDKIVQAFPEPDYRVSVTKWEERGEAVTFTLTVKDKAKD